MKIMIAADVHQRTKVSVLRRRRTLKGIKKAFSEIPCDLAVFLGDLIHGPDYGEDKDKFKRDLLEVLSLTGNVPFAYVFGNHDDECAMTKAEISEIISEYPNAVTTGENRIIEMCGETLVFIDSGSYYEGEGSYYDTVKNETIQWAKEQLEGKKGILFQHIIIPDIAQQIKKTGLNKYRFKEGFEFTGKLREHPCPPDINTGELEKLAPCLKAMVFGHDHLNNFECSLTGVKIIQCAASGINCYEFPKRRPTVRLLDTETLRTEEIHI